MSPLETKDHDNKHEHGQEDAHRHECSCNCHCDCNEKNTDSKSRTLLLHSSEEFFSVGKYLIIGAFITSMIQMIVPKAIFERLSMQSWLSLIIMMFLAFIFSACSTSDAFIAKSYISRFPEGAVMGFMVYGPMMDLKIY